MTVTGELKVMWKIIVVVSVEMCPVFQHLSGNTETVHTEDLFSSIRKFLLPNNFTGLHLCDYYSDIFRLLIIAIFKKCHFTKK